MSFWTLTFFIGLMFSFSFIIILSEPSDGGSGRFTKIGVLVSGGGCSSFFSLLMRLIFLKRLTVELVPRKLVHLAISGYPWIFWPRFCVFLLDFWLEYKSSFELFEFEFNRFLSSWLIKFCLEFFVLGFELKLERIGLDWTFWVLTLTYFRNVSALIFFFFWLYST